jgi:hypothetical protein
MYALFQNYEDCGIAFNQDLSSWCVDLISSEPSDSAGGGSYYQMGIDPVWGTCPARPCTTGADGEVCQVCEASERASKLLS